MPLLNNVLGLDLGSHAIKAVELRQGLRSLESVNARCVPREPDVPLAEQVQRFVTVHRLSTDHVVTALRGDRLSVRRLGFPFSEKRRLAQAVPFEVEDALPFEMEDVVLDWSLAHAERHRADVVAAVAQRREVSELIAALHEAGCDPRTIEAEGLALANLAALFELPEHALLVDIGHAKTTLCGLSQGRPIAARSFRVAGQALSEAIAQDRGLALSEAEREKCETGIFDAAGGRPLPKASAVLDQIAGEMVRFASSLESAVPGGIAHATLFGGTAQLERIDELLAERTGLEVQRLGLPSDEAGASFVAGGSPLLFAPAIALALRGTARRRTDLNFRQDEFAQRFDFGRYRRDFGTTGVLAAVVLALALLSFGTGVMLESRSTGDVEGRIRAIHQGLFPDQPLPANPTAALREAVRSARDRAEFLGVYSGNRSALDLLEEISRHVPADLDVVFEELSIDGQTIRIRVSSQSFEAADRLGAELAEFEPFSQSRIGAIETDRKTGAKHFNVTISLADGGEAS
jgi:general secretion pathway protein L